MSQKILVTGGAGFIGSHLVDALLAAGHSVIVYDDLSTGLPANLEQSLRKIELVVDTIQNLDSLKSATAECDAICHLAAVSRVVEAMQNPLHAHEVNVTGTLNVLEAARTSGARVIFSSSAAVYGDTTQHPTPESASCNPISLYGSQKLAGELYMANYAHLFGLPTISLRYFNVFGPRQRPDSPYSGVISRFAMLGRAHQTMQIHGDGGQSRDFIPVEYVVRANLAALAAPALDGRAVNICSGSTTTVLDLARRIATITGSPAEPELGPAREGDIYLSQGDPSAAQEYLGLNPPADPLATLPDVIRAVEPAGDL